MRWTNMDEKEMIKTWAKEEYLEDLMKECLPVPEQEKESYWCIHEGESDIEEYGFETVPELKEILQEQLKEEFYRDLLLPLVVAVFKEKKIIQLDEGNAEKGKDKEGDADGFSIPEFLYVF